MKQTRTLLFAFLIALLALGSFLQPATATRVSRKFSATLLGSGEVPPRDTIAEGGARFHLSKDGTSLRFVLKVRDINNVVASHIHIGQPGVNGPVVVPLFSGPAGGGPFSGKLASGTITAADLVGPLAGQSLDALMMEIANGNAYVNVHTNDGVGDPNTGPGDFPGGEIRGQIVSDSD
jgi:hypothetical protein